MMGIVFPDLWEKLRQLSLGISDACLDSSGLPSSFLPCQSLNRRDADEEGMRDPSVGTKILTGGGEPDPCKVCVGETWAH